jgi:hypothetical protein
VCVWGGGGHGWCGGRVCVCGVWGAWGVWVWGVERATRERTRPRLHSTTQHSTAQHSTAQHSTAQHSTAQHRHGTAQHSIAAVAPMSCESIMVGEKPDGERLLMQPLPGCGRVGGRSDYLLALVLALMPLPGCGARALWASSRIVQYAAGARRVCWAGVGGRGCTELCGAAVGEGEARGRRKKGGCDEGCGGWRGRIA